MKQVKLNLDNSVWDKIWSHAKEDVNTECGGHLLGLYETTDNGLLIGNVYEVVLIKERGSQSDFEFTADGQMDAYYYGRERGLCYLGTYHSHGQFPAIPSPDDKHVLTRVGREFMLIISPSHDKEKVFVCYKDEYQTIIENPFPLHDSNNALKLHLLDLGEPVIAPPVPEDELINLSVDKLEIEMEDCGGIRFRLNTFPVKGVSFKIVFYRNNNLEVMSLPISTFGFETSYRDGLPKEGTYQCVLKAFKEEHEIASSEGKNFLYQPSAKKKENSRLAYVIVALAALCIGVLGGWFAFHNPLDKSSTNASYSSENKLPYNDYSGLKVKYNNLFKEYSGLKGKHNKLQTNSTILVNGVKKTELPKVPKSKKNKKEKAKTKLNNTSSDAETDLEESGEEGSDE